MALAADAQKEAEKAESARLFVIKEE